MLKKPLALTACTILLTGAQCGCATQSSSTAQCTNSSSEPASASSSLANPWTEFSSVDEVAQATGMLFYVPDGATDITYSAIVSEGLGQVEYTLNEYRVTDRAQKTAEAKDISGMYYQWEHTTTKPLGENGSEATLHWTEGAAGLITSYWEAGGVTYSTSVTGGLINEETLTNVYKKILGQA